MFLANRYTKIYFALIEKHGDPNLIIGEKHHIVPRSLGGSDESTNIVKVPLRIHYILHKLLCRMVSNPVYIRSMHYALWQMMNRGMTFSSRDYEKLRYKMKAYMKEMNPMYNEESRNKLKGKKRPKQSAFMIARNKEYWSTRARPQRTIECAVCGVEIITRDPKRSTCCRAHADELKRILARK